MNATLHSMFGRLAGTSTPARKRRWAAFPTSDRFVLLFLTSVIAAPILHGAPSLSRAPDSIEARPESRDADRVQGKGPRPKVVFVIGENEYHTWETLPEFARSELEPRGVDCAFVHAPPRDGSMDFAGYEVIPEADLLFISVRRRTPAGEMLAMIREHVAAGKPVVGIRTASHAFAATPPDPDHAAWPEFDAEVLGGNYQGHYGNKPPDDPPTRVRRVAAAAGHPVLRGVPAGWMEVTSHLYRNRGASGTIVPLMEGRVGGETTIEPVAWVRQAEDRRVFYTSLGSRDDFRLPAFRRLLLNGTLWALDRSIPAEVAAPATKAGPISEKGPE